MDSTLVFFVSLVLNTGPVEFFQISTDDIYSQEINHFTVTEGSLNDLYEIQDGDAWYVRDNVDFPDKEGDSKEEEIDGYYRISTPQEVGVDLNSVINFTKVSSNQEVKILFGVKAFQDIYTQFGEEKKQ